MHQATRGHRRGQFFFTPPFPPPRQSSSSFFFLLSPSSCFAVISTVTRGPPSSPFFLPVSLFPPPVPGRGSTNPRGGEMRVFPLLFSFPLPSPLPFLFLPFLRGGDGMGEDHQRCFLPFFPPFLSIPLFLFLPDRRKMVKVGG